MGQTRDDVAAFLNGDRIRVGEVRAAIQVVVRGFRFTEEDLVNELVQEVLGRLIQSLSAGRFRGDCSLKTYAQRVAKYACLEHLRKRRMEVAMDIDTAPSRARWSGPEAALLSSEEHLRNLRTFAALPRESQTLLRLIFLEGLSYAEVGRRLGVSENAIKMRVHKIRIACREAIGSEGAAILGGGAQKARR